MDTHDVIVIGAGLAGLQAADVLARAGRDVVVLEAAEEVGGRQRTDAVHGFLLDRGFQVLNPRYPAVARGVDVAALDLRPFPVGVQVRREDGTAQLWHPFRHPTRLPATLRSGLARPGDLVALARWIGPAFLAPQRMVSAPDRTLTNAWDAAGLRGPLRREVLEPFLAGVLADDAGASSDTFARLLVRLFATARPGLPAAGIGALPRQLAARAGDAGVDIRLRRRVTAVTRRGGGWDVAVAGDRTVSARAVVVAVGPESVGALTDLPTPEMRGLQTWWFSAAESPRHPELLAVDGMRAGPVVNSAVISHSVPTYAPAGRHLVQATCLLGPDVADEVSVRRQLTRMWSADAMSWDLLRRDDIPHALPLLRPPMRRSSPAALGDGLFVAGDHRQTPSIQGALASGASAAEAVLSGR